MIEVRQRQLLIDGVPRIVMCGEIHYFRVPRDAWPDRITSLKAAGCTAVASCIRWLFHELPDGSIDVTRTSWPERAQTTMAAALQEQGLLPEVTSAVVGSGNGWSEAIGAIEWDDGEILVVGSSSIGPVVTVFLGSRAIKLIRHSPVPVLVVPGGEVAKDALVQGPR